MLPLGGRVHRQSCYVQHIVLNIARFSTNYSVDPKNKFNSVFDQDYFVKQEKSDQDRFNLFHDENEKTFHIWGNPLTTFVSSETTRYSVFLMYISFWNLATDFCTATRGNKRFDERLT